MRRFIVVILVLVVASLNVKSQENYIREPGRITQYEMSMKEYDRDKDAEAVVLYDLGEYYFEGDEINGRMLLNMKRRVKIKILKQSGIEHTNFEIPYYMEGFNWEEFEYIEGTTYNYENGKLSETPLTKDNIFEEKINNNLSIKKVAFADVKEGSIIEFGYKITTPYYFHMREWMFQRTIPVVYSRLEYRAVPYYDYAYLLKGIDKLDEFDYKAGAFEKRFGSLLYKEMIYTFALNNIPAFKDEEFITSPKDYLIGINFQLARQNFTKGGSKDIITTWPAMCDDLLKDKDFGGYIKSSKNESKKIFPSLALENKTPAQKVEIITNYVKENYNWNNYNSKYASGKLSDFLKRKTGNIGDLNLFLIGLLQAAEIEVYPIVLSTRGNGIIDKQYPFQQFLNYVIALAVVDGKPMFIDASEPLLYYNSLPSRCINVEGLMVKPKSEHWIPISQKYMSFDVKEFQIKINPNSKSMSVDAKFYGTDYEAYHYRKAYMGKEENLINYLKKANNIDVTNGINITENDKLNRPFRFSFHFNTSLESSSDKLFVHPYCNLSIANNPFKQTERKLIVDLIYIRGNIYKSTIEIPDGYKVESIPENYSVNNDIITINCTAQKNDNIIELSAHYSLKKELYAAEDYEKLKESFTDIIKHFSEMVVLVKE